MSWNEFGAAVANHLWQSTLCVGLAWLLTLVLQKHDARVRYWVWCAASLKFLLPLSLLVGLGQRFAWWPAPATSESRITILEQISRPFVLDLNPIGVPAHPIAPVNDLSLAMWGLIGLWLAGFAAAVIYRFLRAREVGALIRHARTLGEGREVESLRRVQSRNKTTSRIALASPVSTVEPCVHGIVRPILLLPVGITDRLDDEQLDTIVAHELSHVLHHDNLTASVHMLVETVFWFHPLVWWIGSRIVEERERACDEDVLRSGVDPDAYASAILTVCEFYISSRSLSMAGIMGSNLKTRIEAIMKRHEVVRLGFLSGLLLATAGLLTVSIPVLYGATQGTHQVRSPATATNSSFEVAIVKPSEMSVPMVHTSSGVNLPVGSLPACRGTDSHPYENVPLNRCIARGHTLKWIIALAYQVPWERVSNLIIGGPDWLDSDGFDVEAKAESPATEAQLHSMLQGLLVEQFNLKLHREKREMRILALVVGKGGSKLTPAPKERNCSDPGACFMGSGISFRGRSQTMTTFANSLSAWVGQVVVDKTSLTGLYDFDTGPWRPEDPGTNFADEAHADANTLPTIFTALQEQLGLRLQSQRAEVEVLVVESADKPK